MKLKKNEYYDLLEKMQRSNKLDLTEWIIWFFQQITSAANTSLKRLDKIRLTTKFWDMNRELAFNSRQTKLISRLLEMDDFEQGISRGKYKSLAHTTDITAARDLKDLLDKQIMQPVGEGVLGCRNGFSWRILLDLAMFILFNKNKY